MQRGIGTYRFLEFRTRNQDEHERSCTDSQDDLPFILCCMFSIHSTGWLITGYWFGVCEAVIRIMFYVIVPDRTFFHDYYDLIRLLLVISEHHRT